MAEPTKQETEQVFRHLKAQKGNKVRLINHYLVLSLTIQPSRPVSIAMPEIRPGPV